MKIEEVSFFQVNRIIRSSNAARVESKSCFLHRPNQGQGMVEFALVLPLLLLIMFGIIEFGRMFFVLSTVYTASREAARFGSAAGKNGSVLQFNDCAGIRAAARRVAVLSNIPDENITIDYDTGPGTGTLPLTDRCPQDPKSIEGGKHRIVVKVKANYQPIVPLVKLSSFDIQSTSARTIFSNVLVGVFPPNPLHVSALTYSPDPPNLCGNHDNNWCTKVYITIEDAEGNPVQNATVAGSWCNGNNGCASSCQTEINGQCYISASDGRNKSDTFTVDDVIHSDHGYDPTSNFINPTEIDIIKP